MQTPDYSSGKGGESGISAVLKSHWSAPRAKQSTLLLRDGAFEAPVKQDGNGGDDRRRLHQGSGLRFRTTPE